MTPSLCGEGKLCIFGEESLTPSPLRIVLVLILGEDSLNPSPCGEGFVGRGSYAFRGEETDFFPMWGRIYWER